MRTFLAPSTNQDTSQPKRKAKPQVLVRCRALIDDLLLASKPYMLAISLSRQSAHRLVLAVLHSEGPVLPANEDRVKYNYLCDNLTKCGMIKHGSKAPPQQFPESLTITGQCTSLITTIVTTVDTNVDDMRQIGKDLTYLNISTPILLKAQGSTTASTQLIAPRSMALKPWTKKEMNIILIGETGVGKTAFMSLLSNVCSGTPLDQFAAAHQEINEAGGSQSGSQTLKPMLYTIECANGATVRILDTPGLADTAGVDKDNEHKADIAEFIRKNTDTVDAVLILANGTNARLGVATEYALAVISGMFPNSLVNNIGFVFTMVANAFSCNFEVLSLPDELRGSRHWKLDNPLAHCLKYQDAQAKSLQGTEEELEEMRLHLDVGYKKTVKVLDDLFAWLDQREVQPTKEISALYEMSMNIDSAIAEVISRMEQTEKRRTELIVLQGLAQKQGQIQNINSKWQEIISREFWEHEKTDNHNTLCIAGNCYSNCHLNCNVPFTLDRQTLGDKCTAFTGSRVTCHECGHSFEEHQHYRSKWVRKTRDVVEVDNKAKARFEAAQTEVDKLEHLRRQMEKSIKRYEEAIREDEEKLSELCVEYNQLALSGSFAGYIFSTVRLLKLRLEDMKQKGQSQDAQARMEDRITMLEKKLAIIKDAEEKKKTSIYQSVVNSLPWNKA